GRTPRSPRSARRSEVPHRTPAASPPETRRARTAPRRPTTRSPASRPAVIASEKAAKPVAATAIATWAVSPTPSRMAIPASAAPAAPPRLKNVKRRHDRTLIAALDGERVGIHRHVEGAVRSAEHGQRERENVVADDGKGQRQTR